MRLAVFTSQFPGRVSTFFARDMRALIEAGLDLQIFPLYPLDPRLWQYVPDILNESIFSRDLVHHLSISQDIVYACQCHPRKIVRNLGYVGAASASAVKFGFIPLIKTWFAILKALAWAKDAKGFDHILAYWGNYAATSAYFFGKLVDKPAPFSMFLHAGTDLYRDQVYLRQKLLYADNIIVVCDFNRRFIHRLYPDIFDAISHKIHVHHLGLDLDRYIYEPQGRPSRKVLGVGNFNKRKGFDYLLRAAHEVAKRGIKIDVELIGDGDEAKSLKALADELNMNERVTFPGWLPFENVRQEMRGATMLVHPSIGLGDAVPTVIKEAMALGTPVVASNVAGIPELLDNGQCGMLVPPKDVNALANAIETILRDNVLRRKYADAAHKYTEEKFDLWRNGRCLAELLFSTRRF